MFKSVSNEEAKKLIQEKKRDAKFSVIDVRTPEEFHEGAIDGAKNINLYDPNFRTELDKLDKKVVYLIYCRSGARSKTALEIMRMLGFETVYELDNGFMNYV
ncbi:MAG: rhodanese-like domain-containing protein [Parcubacteria group bacterium]